MNSVKGQLVSQIAAKTGLNPGQAEQTVPLAQESVTEGLTSAVTSGNVDGILGMLKSATGSGGGDLMQNMVFKGISNNFIGKLTSSLGLDRGVAGTISSMVLPMIVSKLGGATQEAGDTNGIDSGSLMNVLGMDAGGLLGKAKDLLGGGDDKDKDSGGGLLGGLTGF